MEREIQHFKYVIVIAAIIIMFSIEHYVGGMCMIILFSVTKLVDEIREDRKEKEAKATNAL